jgi:hypothetical protein
MWKIRLQQLIEQLKVWAKKNPVLAFIASFISVAHIWIIIQISLSPAELFAPKVVGKVVVQNVTLSPPKSMAATVTAPVPSSAVAAAPKKEVEKPKKQPEKVAAKEPKKPEPKKDPKPVAKTESKKEEKKPAKPMAKEDKKSPKPVAKADPKPAPKKVPKAVAKEAPDPMIKKLEEESMTPEDFALLQAAKQSIAKISKNNDKSSEIASASSLPNVSQLEISVPSSADSSAEEDFYQGDLVRRLQLLLRLPEKGAVTVKVSVTREGKVTGVEIVSSASTRNSDYISTELPKITFQPFGSRFPGEATKIFTLTFESYE